MTAHIVWTQQAISNLESIRDFIHRDSPQAATQLVRQLIHAVDRLEMFPLSGSVVPEWNDSSIREIRFGNYRIVYRAALKHVEILTVHHAARTLSRKPAGNESGESS